MYEMIKIFSAPRKFGNAGEKQNLIENASVSFQTENLSAS